MHDLTSTSLRCAATRRIMSVAVVPTRPTPISNATIRIERGVWSDMSSTRCRGRLGIGTDGHECDGDAVQRCPGAVALHEVDCPPRRTSAEAHDEFDESQVLSLV